jgi:hypothetical protein
VTVLNKSWVWMPIYSWCQYTVVNIGTLLSMTHAASASRRHDCNTFTQKLQHQD